MEVALKSQTGRLTPFGPPEATTIGGLASYLPVAKSSLYKLAQDGKVPVQTVGEHWRSHRAAVDEWLREGTGSQQA